ncbi:malonyl-ACP O-methyltransferase BioC [Nitrosomonas marina]|uniref:Malonyl-[acyl-carrier protein] O-methyltransferase n=1 Tax=Nitrosomonas marina TaxID=917 RepID=A0A1H8ED75_9PROT|nr:malonyl-ACP O-methyltransferase BioC [Nitrosomonas marina]SEN17479.1 malonyl-CoA O-methyltransferase [Nitrosomonas marina]
MNHTILNKRLLRHSFERAAQSYDHAAVLQREVGDRMFARLDYINYVPNTVLDAGCGTGYCTRKLGERYTHSRLMAVDIAQAMLLQARPAETGWRQYWPFNRRQEHYVCADVEQLPLREDGMDMIWSNLALQWCNDLDLTFREMNRVLKPDGLLMFSTFGPDTLQELRQAFSQVDDFVHVNQFIDMHDIGDLLVHNRFATPVMDMEYITLTYGDVVSVMRDLKAIGAHNVAQGRRQGLMGKTKWQKVIDSYECLRRNGKLPATYEVVYGHAWKLPPKETVLTPEIRKQIMMGG